MTTEARPVITGGVDTHLAMHVAAVVTVVGGVLGTAELPPTAAGYRRLLAWMRIFGQLGQVGVKGTGAYGVSLSRHLTLRAGQGRRAHAAQPAGPSQARQDRRRRRDRRGPPRAVRRGQRHPKTHDGPVEALRSLRLLQLNQAWTKDPSRAVLRP